NIVRDWSQLISLYCSVGTYKLNQAGCISEMDACAAHALSCAYPHQRRFSAIPINLSSRATASLCEAGHDAVDVRDIGLRAASA
ncbi:MAG: hypothetical protein ACI8W7_001693, partial [Gammaproteobacteria bacterium]